MLLLGVLLLISASSATSESSPALDYTCMQRKSWLINDNGDVSSVFTSKTDVQSIRRVDASSGQFSVSTTGIPKYDVLVTQAVLDTLNRRPKKSTDFRSNGATTAVLGGTVKFGEDINYATSGCAKGYWPPGPVCPSAQTSSKTFSTAPAKESSTGGCYTSKGSIGTFVNGVAIFDGLDAQSYDSKGVWHSTALAHEVYDLDLCLGHAANGVYHHHSWSPCLAERLADDGTKHSPIFGWVQDGFPIYGPFHSNGTLSVSCWKARDYSSSSTTGCTDSTRSCLLKDQLDFTKGTTSASSAGPPLSGTVTTLSSNTIPSLSGIYLEDYYFDQTCYAQGGAFLNHNNGHEHDNLGFHYHVTIDGSKQPTFPYVIGPQYYGCLPSTATCSLTAGGGGGGGGGGSGPPSAQLRRLQGGAKPAPGGGSSSSKKSTSTCATSAALPSASSACPSNGRTKVTFSVSQVLSGVDSATLSASTKGKSALVALIKASLSSISPSSVTITSITSSTAASHVGLLFSLLSVSSSCTVTTAVDTILQTSGQASATAVTASASSALSLVQSTLATSLKSADPTTFASITAVGTASVGTTTTTILSTESPTSAPNRPPASEPDAKSIGLGVGISLGLILIGTVSYLMYRKRYHSGLQGVAPTHAHAVVVSSAPQGNEAQPLTFDSDGFGMELTGTLPHKAKNAMVKV